MAEVQAGLHAQDIRITRASMPTAVWDVARITASTRLSAKEASEEINRTIRSRFPGGLEPPHELTLGDDPTDPETFGQASLPWPPRGFPAVAADFKLVASEATTTIEVDVHLPYKYTVLIALMVALPAVLCILSRSLVGIPVILIGLIAYTAGRLQGGPMATAQIARLLGG
jgi:hypothetical protein